MNNGDARVEMAKIEAAVAGCDADIAKEEVEMQSVRFRIAGIAAMRAKLIEKARRLQADTIEAVRMADTPVAPIKLVTK
jgi:hypothetical protein